MEGQTARHFELILVDDGSQDDTPSVLARLAAAAPFALRVERLATNSGPAAARNAGWQAARAPLIAFTDDDCVPQPEWLAALLRGLEDAEFVQGRTIPDPAQAQRRGPFSHIINIEEEDGYYATCNMAYQHTLLDKLGGFDEAIRYRRDARRPSPVYGEDTDLAWRALETGARGRFEPDALVFHDVWPSTFVARLHKARRVETLPALVRRHPALRAQMYGRWFYQSYHPPALLAAAGTAVMLRRGPWWRRALGLACWLPYADNRMHRQPLWTRRRKQVALLPAALAADLVEVAVLVRASIRERTILL